MLKTEERLFDEYKRVDNICRDIFLSQSGVNQYIAEMEWNFSYGRSVISSWNDDYYKLKHIRWLRNKIAHESSVTECTYEDVEWLENFHSRLLNGQDPLALLRKTNREQLSFTQQRESRPMVVSEQRTARNARLREKKDSSLKKAVVALIGVGTVLTVLIIVAELFKIATAM